MTLCTVLLLCNLVFIWGNSLLPAEVSGQISGTLKALLDGVFTPGEAVPSGDGLLRKFAHFAEFGALGFLLGRLVGMLGKKRLPAFALGVAAACIDETIQAFTPGRNCALSDVWLDAAGALTGAVLLWLIFKLRKK